MLEEHGRYASASPCNAMTVDVEEYFQVAAFEGRIRRDAWESYRESMAGPDGWPEILSSYATYLKHQETTYEDIIERAS